MYTCVVFQVPFDIIGRRNAVDNARLMLEYHLDHLKVSTCSAASVGIIYMQLCSLKTCIRVIVSQGNFMYRMSSPSSSLAGRWTASCRPTTATRRPPPISLVLGMGESPTEGGVATGGEAGVGGDTVATGGAKGTPGTNIGAHSAVLCGVCECVLFCSASRHSEGGVRGSSEQQLQQTESSERAQPAELSAQQQQPDRQEDTYVSDEEESESGHSVEEDGEESIDDRVSSLPECVCLRMD